MTQRYDAALTSLQGAGRLPAVVAAVARGGVPVWSGCRSALPDSGEGVPISADTAFRIGSITKTMTAVLVVQARDRGLLDLDDPIGRLVPEAPFGDARIRDLLSHTAGLPSEPAGPWWERSQGGSFADLVEANAEVGPVAGAGEFYHYSNLAFALLGEAVARLGDTTWWEAVQVSLLGPLGMAATTHAPPEDHAPGHSVDQFAHTLTDEPLTDTGAMAPAGQLWSTAADLLRWADFLATGHPEVLDVASLDVMATPAAAAPAYGLGLRRVAVGGRGFVGHTGSMPGFQASLFVDRASRDAVAVLANSTTGLRSEAMAGVFLGDDPLPPGEEWRPSASVPALARELLGVWFWGNTAFGFEWCGGELVARDLRTAEVSDRFVLAGDEVIGSEGYHRGERLELVRDARGAVSHLVVATFVHTRTPYDPRVPIPGGHPS